MVRAGHISITSPQPSALNPFYRIVIQVSNVFSNLKKKCYYESPISGTVGDWKNWFTVAQNERFNTWLENNLVNTDLNFKYSL